MPRQAMATSDDAVSAMGPRILVMSTRRVWVTAAWTAAVSMREEETSTSATSCSRTSPGSVCARAPNVAGNAAVLRDLVLEVFEVGAPPNRGYNHGGRVTTDAACFGCSPYELPESILVVPTGGALPQPTEVAAPYEAEALEREANSTKVTLTRDLAAFPWSSRSGSAAG